LVELLKPKRRPGRNPLFDIKIAHQNVPEPTITGSALKLRGVARDQWPAKFDLYLSILEGRREPILQLEYSTDLFNASTIAEMLSELEALLEEAVKRPNASINSLRRALMDMRLERQAQKEQELERLRLEKFKNLKRRSTRRAQ